MAKEKSRVNRRGFLKGAAAGAAVGAAALVVPGAAPLSAAGGEQQGAPKPAPSSAPAPEQGARMQAAEREALPAEPTVFTVDDPGSDFMVDVFKTLDFDYAIANPASSFRGLHESFINYGGNKAPTWITCCHEEAATNIANGYYLVSGRPALMVTFAPAGLQHAMMGIFDAFCGHIPTYIICGDYLDANERRPGTDWAGHSVMDPAVLIRDSVKWDDTPVSLQHFAESAVRAYKIAMTEPRGPLFLVADATLQENPVPNRKSLHIPKLTLTRPPAGDAGAVAEAAKMLVNAENPVILAGDVARDEEGLRLIVELAETLQAPVQGGGRSMPNRHPLAGGGSVRNADVILGLNEVRFYGLLNRFKDQQIRTSSPLTKAGVKVITISSFDLFMKSNYQNVDRYTEVDLAIAADPQGDAAGAD